MAGSEIRVITDLDSMHETLAVQEAAWGFDDFEKVPSRLMLVSSKVGGLMLGCYNEDRLIGFSYSVCGCKPTGEVYLHSHMTALLPEHQGRGLGYELKMRQRTKALERGFTLIEWPFEPFESRNAHVNLEKPGVICRSYEPNLYGITTSRLHGGLPTDRLVAEWRLDEPRSTREVEAEIKVPGERTHEAQSEVRQRFPDCFSGGRAVIGHRRNEGQNTYLLAKL